MGIVLVLLGMFFVSIKVVLNFFRDLVKVNNVLVIIFGFVKGNKIC